MSVLFLIVLIGAALVHGFVVRKHPGPALAELVLVYILAGYCGAYAASASIVDLVASFRGSTVFPFPAGSPFQQFFDFAFLGMASAAISSIWLRGPHLIALTVAWSIFWFGATCIHLVNIHASNAFSLHAILFVFLSHGFVAFLMISLLVFSRRCSHRHAQVPGNGFEDADRVQ